MSEEYFLFGTWITTYYGVIYFMYSVEYWDFLSSGAEDFSLIWLQYAEFSIVIDPCSAVTTYWQKRVKQILVIKCFTVTAYNSIWNKAWHIFS